MKNKIILAAFIFAISGIMIYGVKTAEAMGPTPNMSSFLAQRPGLDENKIKDALTAFRGKHKAQMATHFEDRLTRLVEDGKITKEQKQAILSKMAELKTKHDQNLDAFKNMSPEDRKNTMEKEREELNSWAKANNIDLKYMLGFGHKMVKMHHGRMK